MNPSSLPSRPPEVVVAAKPWYKSRTVWLNVATLLAGAGPVVANFTGLVNPLVYAVMLTIVGGANIGLRFLTDKGIE